jgi:hypothetical protein
MGDKFKGTPWSENENKIVLDAVEAATGNGEFSPWQLSKDLTESLPNRTDRAIDAKVRGILRKRQKAAEEVPELVGAS